MDTLGRRREVHRQAAVENTSGDVLHQSTNSPRPAVDRDDATSRSISGNAARSSASLGSALRSTDVIAWKHAPVARATSTWRTPSPRNARHPAVSLIAAPRSLPNLSGSCPLVGALERDGANFSEVPGSTEPALVSRVASQVTAR